jgi:hypothetical protein
MSTEQIEDALGYLVALRWLRAEEMTTKRGGRPTVKHFVNDVKARGEISKGLDEEFRGSR